MKIKDMIAQIRNGQAAKLSERNTLRKKVDEVRAACAADSDRDPTEDEATQVREAQEKIRAIDAELEVSQARVTELEEEQARDEAADRLQGQVQPGAQGRAYDDVARVGQEKRQYNPGADPKGKNFVRDVGAAFLGNAQAQARLNRHMDEELVERGDQLKNRATNTGSFEGLVVPQYLTDLYAPVARAGRPFADACRHHDLPETGMVAYIGRLTTGTNVDDQANQGDEVAEQDADDTLISVPIRTAAGQQKMSRQAVDRGVGVEDTILEDLYRAYGTNLDNKLLNRAVTGLSAVATLISYTDASPTAAELYPKLVQAPGMVEAAMLDQDQGDTLSVMRSLRWYWLQSQLTSTWPMFGQPGVAAQLGGVNYGEKYGSGFRGLLPAGTPVVVDNNAAANLGAGTNEDEIYFAAQNELHLWEEPNAPMLIRAEQPYASKLQVQVVVYGYYANLFNRRPHVYKIGGTGLVTPAFA